MRRACDLVNLGPAVLDARYVKQGRTVLPEGSLLDIEDESDGREVHVGVYTFQPSHSWQSCLVQANS